MPDSAETRQRILELPPKRLALLALELQAELTREHERRSEPIAVVGMACRFPGAANSPEAFWALLADGRDVIGPVPGDRWSSDALYDPDPDAPGRVATRWGGFLDDVQHFDAAFFSISPREARAMDPQQRLLLETAWRAFENAGIPPSRHHGERAGVFVGICANDYLTRLLTQGPEATDIYLSSGNAYGVAAGRLSFSFGFQGPAMAIDTACSSSLVAIHTACQSLRAGESTLALAAGVNVMCSPEITMSLSRARVMAPDGRCKTFDDRADGFVRSEGCGVLILKRLSTALRDGDRVHALLRGTAIGQDGRSTGLTVPNGPAQEQVVRDALAQAGLHPSDVDYVEAHGTGTSLGDPIEIRALGRVFGAEREVPLYVGSVKTNMGHLEAAAGIAGVVKAILSIQKGWIPPHLHFQTPSRHIEWAEHSVRVAAEEMPWPVTGRPRRAGVSSFGFSGTNAHLIVEEAPLRAEPSVASQRPAELLLASATSELALNELTVELRGALDTLPPAEFANFCHTTRVGRTHFAYRRAVVAADAEEARAAFAEAEHAALRLDSLGRCADSPPLVFVFTGQGSQYPGMGRALYETAPAFRTAIERCAHVLDPLLGIPLPRLLFEGDGESAPLYRTSLAQPAVAAFEYALAELWRSWGVRPAAVLGHSLGEFAAAAVAGILTPEDMLRLVRERGRLLDSLPGGDRMAALFAAPEVVEKLLRDHADQVSIAAFNGPANTVISGHASSVDTVLAACGALGIEHRVLRLDKGFHSPKVEPILDELDAVAHALEHRAPEIPVAWNVSGEFGGADAPLPDYWRRHARLPVRFTESVRALAARGFRHFLEVGPHPTLLPVIGQTLEGEAPVLIPSLRRESDAWRDIAEALGHLYISGVEVDWSAFDSQEDLRRISIPGHPFRGEAYWVDPPEDARPAAPRGAVPGIRLATAVPTYETVFTPERPAFLTDHRYRGESVVPGPVFVELALEAARAQGRRPSVIEALEIRAPAVVTGSGLRIQTVLEPRAAGDLKFRIFSTPAERSADGDPSWTEHASGVLLASPAEPATPTVPAEETAIWTSVDVADHLERIRAIGFDLGRSVVLFDDLEVAPGRGRAALRPPAEPSAEPLARALLLDSAVQVLGATLAQAAEWEPRMLTGVDRIEVLGDIGRATSCSATTQTTADDGSLTGEVRVRDAEGSVVARLDGIRLRRLRPGPADASTWFHRLEWRPAALADTRTGEPIFGTRTLAQAASQVAARWPAIVKEAALEGYVNELPRLSMRVAAHLWTTLQRLGLTADSETQIDAASLADRLEIAPARRRLFFRLLGILAEQGYLGSTGERSYHILPGAEARALEHAPPAAPGCQPVYDLVDRCGASLAEVLTGETDPLTLLFPDGGEQLTREIYRSSPFGRAFNEALTAVVTGLASEFSGNGPLRVLEVGAGSGSSTEAVLRGLGDHQVEYDFTDISPTLVHQARVLMSERPGIQFRVLDIESNPLSQGFDAARYDLVIAANVLHATAELASSLDHVRRLLAPGGVLLLLEGTRPEPWVDLTFGLTDGWWRFRDTALRPEYPLLAPEEWLEAIAGAGFVEGAALVSGPLAQGAGQVVLGARNPAAAAPTTVILATESPLRASLAAAGVRALVASCAGAAGAGTALAVVVDARGGVGWRALLGVMKEVATAPAPARLWLLTEAAQSIVADDRPDPDAAVLWGLARTFALEHPDRWGGAIDLAPGTEDERAAEFLLGEIYAHGQEDQTAYRDGVRHLPRLVRTPAPAAAPLELGDGTYLVTGGLGGLGLKVAHWLAAKGAKRLFLVGRSASPECWPEGDRRARAVAELRAAGVDVQLRAVDLTERDAVHALLAEIRSDAAPLRGIVHAAAVFDESPIATLSPEAVAAVLAPKAEGAKHLVDLARGDPLDFFVLFSSTTSILGVAGLAAYTAANQYLDALAAQTSAEGTPIVAINWGTWDEMRLASSEDTERYALSGLRPMESAAALDALAQVIVSGTAGAVIADVDWGRLRAVYESKRPRPLLHELDAEPASAETASSRATQQVNEGLDSLFALTPEVRRDRILAGIEQEIRAVLRLPATRSIDHSVGFFEMGMDSLMSVELKARLERRFSVRLPATLTFNYPSVAAVGGFLEARAPRQPNARPAGASVRAPELTIGAELSEADLSGLLAERLIRLESEIMQR